MPATVASSSREIVSRSVADQFTPVLKVYDEVRAATRAVVTVEKARARIEGGRPAFDAVRLLGRSRALVPAFDRAVDALELCGLVSTSMATAVRRGDYDARVLAVAWASGDAPPSAPAHRAARRAAGIVANAVLRKNAARVSRGAAAAIAAWMRPMCPCCGAVPDLAFGGGAQRLLICSRCDMRWKVAGRGCLTCDASTPPVVARVRTPYLGYELVICHACGRYLKERAASSAPRYHPLVERALTAEMDAAAERRGLRL